MAIYDLSNTLACHTAELRFQKLKEAGKVIEITDKSSVRTPKQNSYLHLLLQYTAAEIGESDVDFVKRYYFKAIANQDLFAYKTKDKALGNDVIRLKSSRDLTTEEMATAIDRYKLWCRDNLNIILPDAEDKNLVAAMQAEVNRNLKYIYG